MATILRDIEQGTGKRQNSLLTDRRLLMHAPAYLLVATILALAVAFGGVEAWAQSMAWFGVGSAGLALGLMLMSRVELPRWDVRPVVVPGLLFVGLLVFISMQSVPGLPQSVWHPIWAQASAALSASLNGTISATPGITRNALGWYQYYLVLFLLGWAVGRNRDSAEAGLKALLVIQVGLACYGAFVLATGNTAVAFAERVAYRDSLTATFINKNSYATFVGLGVVTALGMIVSTLRREINREDPLHIQVRTVIQLLITRYFLLVLCFSILCVALSFTGSRAGVLTTALACGIMIILVLSRRGLRMQSLLGAAALLALGVGGIMSIAGGRMTEGFSSASAFDSIDDRSVIYKSAITAFHHTPLLGNGLGSFEYVFTPYIADELIGLRSVVDAHSSYLENMIELGWPGTLVLLISLGLLAFACYNGIYRRKRVLPYSLIGLGATVQVGLHSLVDFSLEIPAVTSVYVLLLAFGVAQSTSTRWH